MENKKSNSVYLARFIALICVTSAHASIGDGYLINSFANAGVAIFFMASGIYYKPCSLREWLKKSKKILIPWCFFGSITFILNCIITNKFSLIDYFLWLVGYNTYLWYLTIYFLTMLFFSMCSIEKKKRMQILLIVLMVISRIASALLNISGAASFLNPFNWMGFVAAGILSSEYFDELYDSTKSFWKLAVMLIGVLGCTFLGKILNDKTHYFGIISVFSQFIWCYLILYMTTRLGTLGWVKKLNNVGKNSLPIYLVHISIINWLAAHLHVSGIMSVLISVIVVLGIYLVFAVTSRIFSFNKKVYNLFQLLSGFVKGE